MTNLVTRSGTVALGRATSTYPGDNPMLVVYEKRALIQSTAKARLKAT